MASTPPIPELEPDVQFDRREASAESEEPPRKSEWFHVELGEAVRLIGILMGSSRGTVTKDAVTPGSGSASSG